MVRPAAAEAGAPGLTPQELRHTAATTLDRYSDLSDREAVADRLDELRAANVGANVVLLPASEMR